LLVDVEFEYDPSQDKSEEEQRKLFDEMMKRTEAMKKVDTWKVATFWSVPKGD